MRKPIKEIEIEWDDEAHTIMQVAQRLPPQHVYMMKSLMYSQVKIILFQLWIVFGPLHLLM